MEPELVDKLLVALLVDLLPMHRHRDNLSLALIVLGLKRANYAVKCFAPIAVLNLGGERDM